MNEKIVFLDDSDDLRDALASFVRIKLQEKCLCFSSFAEFTSHAKEVLNSRVAIIDINLGPNEPTGLDAHQWLRDNGYKGKIFFLTGHAKSHPLVAQAMLSGTHVYEKPMDATKLCQIIKDSIND